MLDDDAAESFEAVHLDGGADMGADREVAHGGRTGLNDGGKIGCGGHAVHFTRTTA